MRKNTLKITTKAGSAEAHGVLSIICLTLLVFGLLALLACSVIPESNLPSAIG